MALLEDCQTIPLSPMHVVDGLVKGTLEPARARLIIQALRMAGRNDTWTVEEESDTIMTVDQQEPGIFAVHSGSTAVGSDGTAYNTC